MNTDNSGTGCASGAEEKPVLSLVMMAKDEEENLPRALDSAARWVDEIVMVDTGSTDATVKIAESFGAKVYHHPWRNDFSLHRNQALSYAAGDWCLQLDADEALDRNTAPLMRELISGNGTNGFLLEMYNMVAGRPGSLSYLLRLFRNIPGVGYFQRMHNQLKVPGGLSTCGVRFYHYGYDLAPEAMAKKHQRRMGMVERWLKEEPDNWIAHYRAAQTMALKPVQGGPGSPERNRALQELVSHGLKALELAESQGLGTDAYLPLLPQLVEALSLLKMDPPLGAILEKWRLATPGNVDLWFFYTEYHMAKRQWEEVERCGEEYFRAMKNLASFMCNNTRVEVFTASKGSLVAVGLLLAKAHLGRREKAAELVQYLSRRQDGEAAGRAAAGRMLRDGLGDFALFTARTARGLAPAWQWPAELVGGN